MCSWLFSVSEKNMLVAVENAAVSHPISSVRRPTCPTHPESLAPLPCLPGLYRVSKNCRCSLLRGRAAWSHVQVVAQWQCSRKPTPIGATTCPGMAPAGADAIRAKVPRYIRKRTRLSLNMTRQDNHSPILLELQAGGYSAGLIWWVCRYLLLMQAAV